jgi:glycosyltransferase involved in cell wall biosynthesis
VAANKQDPRNLSIITINYNNINGLKRTVESVINQICRGVEYIIIDGGSTDGSAEYIFEMKDHFSYYVSEPDKGIYSAMNKGIQVAVGEYLLFLNSGDCLAESTVLEKVMEEINGCCENQDKLFVGSTIQSGIGKMHQPPKVWSLHYLYSTSLPHQGMFIPRKICINIPYNEDYVSASDWLHSFEMLINGVKYRRLKSINIITVNEPYGISSKPIFIQEKEQMIKNNLCYFSGFADLELNRKMNMQRTLIINSNILNKFLWYTMKFLWYTKNKIYKTIYKRIFP